MANTFAHTHTQPTWLQAQAVTSSWGLVNHCGCRSLRTSELFVSQCIRGGAVWPLLRWSKLRRRMFLSDSVSEAASRVWWARVLLHHAHTLGLKIPNSEAASPVKVLSACTGSFAEGACFKERVGFPMRRLRQWGQGVIKSSVVNFRLSLGPK